MTTKKAAHYKKGDKVRILIGEDDKAHYGMAPAMRKVKGQVGTITRTPRHPSSVLAVHHPAFGNSSLNYAAHELEPYHGATESVTLANGHVLSREIIAAAPPEATHYHPALAHKYLSTAASVHGRYYDDVTGKWKHYHRPFPEHFANAIPLLVGGTPQKAEPIAPDLLFLAEEVTEWPEGAEDVALDNDGEVRFYPGTHEDYYPEGRALSRAITVARHRLARRIFSYDTWLQARSRLPQALPEGSTSPADKPEAARVDYLPPGVQSRDELVKENASLAKQIASLRDRLDRKLNFVVENDKKIAAWDILLKD